MRTQSKALKRMLCAVLMLLSLVVALPSKVYGAEDPGLGTASNEIENMIAVGKTLIGKTPYVYGGGHHDWETQKGKDIPTGLDCSSYVAWAMYRGMGIDLGMAPVSGSFGQYLDEVATGTLVGAKRGDIIAHSGHIEIYLGEGEDGKHYSLHATNERQDVNITEVNWGNGVEGKEILRINLDSAKAGKNGMKYTPNVIIDGGVGGTPQKEATETTETAVTSDEDLFSWLNPIVDFTGSSNTHSKSTPKEKQIDGSNKGLKGHQKGIFEGIFGGF